MLYVLLVEYQTSLVAQMIKNPPERQETQIQSLGWENPLEKKLATYSSIFAWEIPWTEEPIAHEQWAIAHGVTKSMI